MERRGGQGRRRTDRDRADVLDWPVLEFLPRVWQRLSGSYWLIPGVFVVGAAVAAILLILIDQALTDRGTPAWTYAGGPTNASDTLTTISSSMITFTGLVFSITVLALQLTSSQFSPRALRNFLRDKVVQVSLGVFLATFAYTFTALSSVRVASGEDPSFVPALTVTGSFVLTGASLLFFVQYIHHMAQAVRVVTIVERIANETKEAIDRAHPPDATGPDGDDTPAAPTRGAPRHVVAARRAGVLLSTELSGLAHRAARRGVTVTVLHPVGTFVCEGQPILALERTWLHQGTAVHGDRDGDGDRDRDRNGDGSGDGAEGDDEDAAAEAQHDAAWVRLLPVAREREVRDDPAFGFRQLVDIAERALSPGINDPTTAVQCLDHLHDLLRRLVNRPMPAWQVAIHDDAVVARAPSLTFAVLVDLALAEIIYFGRDAIQVRRRLVAMLHDLISEADSPERRLILTARLTSLDEEPEPSRQPVGDST